MRRNPQSGISLLETMIALAVMALIAVVLGAGLGGSARVLRSSVGVSEQLDQALARRDLRNWVEKALQNGFPGQSDGGLSGRTDHLRFSFVADDGQFWAGAPVMVTVSDDPNGAVTLTAEGQIAADGKTIKRVQALAQPKATLRIAFFGRQRPEDAMSWQNEWSPEAGLPSLIRFTITTPTGAHAPLTIRPAKALAQSEMSLSSLVPPALPSRP